MVRSTEPDLSLARRPAVSVIIPVHNGVEELKPCLQALAASLVPFECIVVDDGSTDASAVVAQTAGATVLSTGAKKKGPAFARNLGAAAASADLLVFLDADVCVKSDTLTRIIAAFSADKQMSALFGSYDDSPSKPDFLSQYRNLMHHFVHQRSRREAHTFWSGCGAIRKAVFMEHGGFDTSFSRPAVEDIELGHRLRRSGCKIVLDATLQVKHLKEWSFWGLLTTDVRDRAIPWTELMLRDSQIPNDLNVGISQRISVALAFIITGIAVAASLMHAQIFLAPSVALLFLMLAAYEVELTTARRFKGTIATALLIAILAVTSFWSDQPLIFAVSVLAFLLLLLRRHYYSPEHRYRRPIAILAGLILVTAIIFVASQPGAHLLHVLFLAAGGVFIVLNARFYALLASKRGRLFSIAAIPFHVLFFLYSGVAFLIGVARHFFRTRCDTGDHRLATRRHWRL